MNKNPYDVVVAYIFFISHGLMTRQMQCNLLNYVPVDFDKEREEKRKNEE